MNFVVQEANMVWFKNLKVRNKLLLSFMVVVLLAVAAGVFVLVNMDNISGSYSNAMELSSQRIEHIFASKDHFTKARMMIREAYYPDNTREDLIRLSDGIDAEMNVLAESLNRVYEVAPPDVQAKVETVKPLVERYRGDAKTVIGMLLAVDEISLENPAYVAAMIKAEQMTVEMGRTYTNEMTSTIDNLPGMAIDVLKGLAAENDVKAVGAMYISIGILAGVALLSIGIALFVAGLISKPLVALAAFMKKAGTTGDITLEAVDVITIGEMVHIKDEIGQTIDGASSFIGHVTNIAEELNTVASGNLCAEIELLSNADTMGKSLKDMVDNLNNMFGEIRDSTDQVATGSKQVADGAHSLAQGSTEQAATVQQLSSSMADIAGKTKENADLAEKAAALAETIRGKAERGSLQMKAMMNAVKDINQASQNISKVI